MVVMMEVEWVTGGAAGKGGAGLAKSKSKTANSKHKFKTPK
jgi:hypothetical protein